MAVAQDGNKTIFPVALPLTERETLDAWHFFLDHLHANVTPQECIYFITDSHNDIKDAFHATSRWMNPPHACHVYCIRHIYANFTGHFKTKKCNG